ncbi:MAG TPA: trimethylamine methyltransferase family protein [Anaerolineales bacterium]|jgi:trimethylamine--corrinoid protein Co-methyltransferase|nr:trimethylamine methyltransferase family protein [Anaerolineales bacterium]
MNNVRPQMKMLTEEQIHDIHEYTMTLLETTGVRVDSPSAVEMLEKRVGRLNVEGRSVRIPREVVEWAIKSAPRRIQIYDRRGNPQFQIGSEEDRARFGIGVTALFYQEPETDTPVEFQRKHMRDMVRVGNKLPLYDIVSTIGICRDVPDYLTDLIGSLEHFANGIKPMVLLCSDEHKFDDVLRMFEHLYGGTLGEKPFVIPYFNPVSPLVMNAGTVDKMKIAIERGLPVIVSNYSLSGATTPITPAGTIAVLLAELLAGLVIGQLYKEGAPMLLGMLPVYLDMKTLQNFYDPQSILVSLACAEMMAHYGIPHCGTSGSGTGWGMDLLAAETFWMNTLMMTLTKGGIAPFIGDTLGSKAVSPLTFIYCHEIIDQALRFSSGLQLDSPSVGLSEIRDVGPGKGYVSAPSTLKNYKTGYYVSRIFPRWSMEKWLEAGQPHAQTRLKEYSIEFLKDLPAPEDYEELMRKGEEFVEEWERKRK